MRYRFSAPTAPILLLGCFLGSFAAPPADPYLWLEEIESPKALAWVEARNERTMERLAGKPEYDALYRDALAVLDSKSRIPEVDQRGEFVYDLWKDAVHPRGLYRRTTVDSLGKSDLAWETVLDIDALAKSEGERWAFGGMSCLPPAYDKCLLRLSPGGGDAVEVREFDMSRRAVVEDGFRLGTAKSRVSWIDDDSVYLGTDFGEGSLTSSGYPRIVKIWRRGTSSDEAKTVYEASTTSVSASAQRIRTSGGDIDVLTDQLTFWKARTFQIVDGRLERLDLPETARVRGGYAGRLVIELKEDWARNGRTWTSGSVLLADPAALRGGKGGVELLVRPSRREVVQQVRAMPQGVFVTALDDVRGRLYRYRPAGPGPRRLSVPFPDNGALRIASTSDETGDVFVAYESFLTPPTLYRLSAGAERPAPDPVTSQDPTFDGGEFRVQQLWTKSADGTRIPYFVVGPKEMKLDGKHPVWMFSYGGFENSLTPSYSGSYEDLHGAYGKLWLERGGVFVLANIRGGGEFGPAWHTGALLENHVRTFEDFEAVARDLVRRRITSPAHLGIEGRSNGGLLVSATMVRHPELYGAIVCGNPLIDMRRYSKLLAGASWMAEYGDPDRPEDWAFLSSYSPYQNVAPERSYPPIFFYSSTLDDRVHPGHARKMAARMDEWGYEVEYFENTEGGHHGSVTNEQLAKRLALTYTFLWETLRDQSALSR